MANCLVLHEQANAINVLFGHFSKGFSRFDETATRDILAHPKAEVLIYAQAMVACGWHHSNAMERYEGEDDFTARAPNDTQYFSRIALIYLDAHFTGGGHVWVVPERLTEKLQRQWGLNFFLGQALSSMAKAKKPERPRPPRD